MINRTVWSLGIAGALGAALSASSACSKGSSPPGFEDDDGGTSATNENGNNGSSNNNGSTGNSGSTGNNGSTGNSGSTSGSATSSASTSTGTGTSNSGAMYCGTSGTYATACSAPDPGDAGIPLADCVPFAITNNSDGYVSAFGDGTSAACVNTNSLCATGNTTAFVAAESSTTYGSGIAITLGAGATASGSALGYAVTSIPTYGLQISVTSGTTSYYAEIAAGGSASGTIPWTTFNTLGYDPVPDGGAFATGQPVATISFQAKSGAATADWSFCVTSLTGLAF